MTTQQDKPALVAYNDSLPPEERTLLEQYWPNLLTPQGRQDFTTDDYQRYLAEEVFGFCGCGMPWAFLDFMLQRLDEIDLVQRECWEIADDTSEGRARRQLWWAEHKKRLNGLFRSNGEMYFFYYWADSMGLTEHGGSVPGWMDNKGALILAMLKEYKAQAGDDYETDSPVVSEG